MLCLPFLVLALPLDSAGIYLTANDFRQRHIAYATTNKNLHLPFPQMSDVLKVRTPAGKTIKVSAKNIYGYRKDGLDFRFVSAANAATKSDADRFICIRSVSPVYLYSYSVVVHYGTVRYWFYSMRADTPLRLLTAQNLIKDFPDAPGLAQEIDQDKKLHYDMGTLDSDGQLRVVRILKKYLSVTK